MIPVLYLAYHFSDRALRPRGLAPHLPARGVRPLIVCAESSPLPSESPMPVALGECPPEAPVVVKVPDPALSRLRPALFSGPRGAAGGEPPPLRGSSRSRAWLRRLEEGLAPPDRCAFWIAPAFRAGIRLAREHGCRAVLASCGPPSALVAGARLATRLRVPLVCEFRDLWVDNHFRTYHLRLRRWLDRTWERRILRGASGVIVVTEQMRPILLAAHPDLDPSLLHWIPNGFDLANLDDARSAGSAPRSGRPRIVFAGRVYGNMPSETLAAALRRLAERLPGEHAPLARLVGWVDGPHRAVIHALVREGLAEVLPPCSYKESLEEMRGADALLLFLGNGPGMEMVMTSKIFPYLASGRPIVAAVPGRGAAAELLRAAGSAVIADPDDPEGLAKAIEAAVTPGGIALDPARVRAILAPHAWPTLAERMASILARVVGIAS